MKHLFTLITLLLLTLPLHAKEEGPIWIDPETAAKEDPDFLIQGEYHKEGAPWSVQVIAQGDGKFTGTLYEGGLPGAGWKPDAKRYNLKGGRDGDVIKLQGGFSNRRVNLEFNATIENSQLTLDVTDEPPLTLPRIERSSPTLGAKPPAGAVVLFDGTSADAWENGLMENGLLKANNSRSKQSFKSYRAHIEFRTPYKPFTQGQHRGNSGVYHQGRWETQILDSFGKGGSHNETGGIYSIAKPRLNMCLPPLSWQTYDVDFTAATFDKDGKRITWPRITVKLNGELIHENQELGKNSTTAAPIRSELTDEGGPLLLQEHKNPVYFRNIWVLPQ